MSLFPLKPRAPGVPAIPIFRHSSKIRLRAPRGDITIIIELSNFKPGERIDPMEAKQIVAALGALGQDTRLEVFRVLVQRGPDGLAAGAIAQALGVPPSSLTFHLQQLNHAGLITHRRLSRQLIYAANFSAMNEIIGYLTENCFGGNTALCTPKVKPAKTKASSLR